MSGFWSAVETRAYPIFLVGWFSDSDAFFLPFSATPDFVDGLGFRTFLRGFSLTPFQLPIDSLADELRALLFADQSINAPRNIFLQAHENGGYF
jgi:hypothetical protein